MYIVYICIYLAHFIFKKNEGGRGRKQISTYKTCYEIKKISTSLLTVEGSGGGGGGGGVHFFRYFGNTYASIPKMTCNVHSSTITDVKSFAED